MSIEKDLSEAIKKNLPSEVGDSLKEALRQGGEAARAVKRLEAQVLKQDSEVDAWKAIIAEQNKVIEAAGILTARETAVRDSENAIDVRVAEIHESAAQRRADDLKDLFALVFSNPKIKRVVRVSEENPQVNSDGYSSGILHSSKITETTEGPDDGRS